MLLAAFALALSLTTFLLMFAFIRKVILPENSVRQRIFALDADNQLLAEKQTGRRKLKDIPFMERVVKPAGEYLAESIQRFTPKQVLALVEKRLIMAGRIDECTAPQFIAVCFLGALTMWLLMFYLVSDSHYLLIQKAVYILLGGILGGLMPVVCLNTMAQKRQEQIACQLPEVLDLLCVSVQAGLSFDAALSKITARMKGELIRECKHMQEDIRMGMVRRTAMKNMADRCDVQDVSLFMTSVIQAERLGTSMGKTLKNQADNIRERRRQYIKAEAMRAPVKIVFPLVIFIFPALFVVTSVPTLLFLIKNML